MAKPPRFVLAIDEGTTGTSANLFDRRGALVARAYEEIPQFYPKPGWVEHDAEAIWQATHRSMRSVLRRTRSTAADVAAIGITNQRETLVAWDAKTLRPISRAIVWQCRRTADLCGKLKADGEEDWVRARTGLLLDPYFSATKIRWFVENDAKVQRARRDGRLRFGTIDSWLLTRLTAGRTFGVDASNASRTLLMDLAKVAYDDELMELFKARPEELPAIVDSSGHLGDTDAAVLGKPVPITGIAGDQQAALFGQACFDTGMMKNTYGTGCFALVNAGPRIPRPAKGILATLAWRWKGRPTYALEGAVFVGGAVIQWLRDGLGLFKESKDSEALARRVPDSGGAVLVPAFTGLGAPHWDPYARGALLGITRGTTGAHVTRAALESIAFQSAEVVRLLAAGAAAETSVLRVDGGATGNSLLMQYQADLLGVTVERARYAETTAQGAAFLAGLGSGFWHSSSEVATLWKAGGRFRPRRGEAWRRDEWTRWNRAVERAKGWAPASP